MSDEVKQEVQRIPRTKKTISAILAIIAVLAILSTFLPWYHISGRSSFGASINMSITGVNGDGIVGLIVGAICLIMALCRTKWCTLPGAINVVLAVMFLLDRNTGSLSGGSNNPGSGLIIFVVTSIAFVGLSLTLWTKSASHATTEQAMN